MEWLWYASGFLIAYAYAGYPVLLWIWSRLKRRPQSRSPSFEWPTVSLIIPAYNERDFLPQKLDNVLNLDYPHDKLQVLWVIEGSTDNSETFLRDAIAQMSSSAPQMKVLGGASRKGKGNAIESAIRYAIGEILVISDANTLMPREALKSLILPFQDEKVGAVAGEKRVLSDASLTGEGESIYWRYESFIKTHMARVFGCIGTVGELHAVRKSLYPHLRSHNYFLHEDLVVSMEILRASYKVEYAPEAYTVEAPSLSWKEELRRKIRMAAGTLSLMKTYSDWLYFWRHPYLFYHFFSYKLLRWYVVPAALPTFLILNVFILEVGLLPKIVMGLQALFYLCVILGMIGLREKIFRLPAYFFLANMAQVLGVVKYLRESKKGLPYWEKVRRKAL